MQDSKVWLGLGSQFGFWPFILAYIFRIKCLSCQKDRFHFMKQHVYNIEDSIVWPGLGSPFRFWPFIWACIIQTKCLSCKKVLYHFKQSHMYITCKNGWCHLMQSDNCIKCKIVKWDLAFNHCLGFDHLFWPISFKWSAYHARRLGVISCIITSASHAR